MTDRGRTGFTLIEIMVVSAITMILLLMASSSFQQMQRVSADTRSLSRISLYGHMALREIESELRKTQQGRITFRKGDDTSGYRINVAGGVCSPALPANAAWDNDSVAQYPELLIGECSFDDDDTPGVFEAECTGWNRADPAASLNNAWRTGDLTMLGLQSGSDVLISCRRNQAPRIIAHGVTDLRFEDHSDDGNLGESEIRVSITVAQTGGLSRLNEQEYQRIIQLRND